MSPAQFHDQNNVRKEPVALSAISQSSSFPLKINKDSHFIKKPSLSSSPSSSSSSSSSSLVNGVTNGTNNKPQHKQPQPQQQQHRHPVIIYTHSPKIIHTHPKDFMALVQKLTGLSRSDAVPHNNNNNNNNNHNHPHNSSSSKLDQNGNVDESNDEDHKKINKASGAPAGMAAMMMMSDDNESTSVVTDDNNGGGSSGTTLGEAQVNSCFVPPPIFDPAPPNPCFNTIPFFNPNSADFLCTSSHHHHHHQQQQHQHQPFYNYSEDSSLFFMHNIRSSLSSSTLEGMKELPDF